MTENMLPLKKNILDEIEIIIKWQHGFIIIWIIISHLNFYLTKCVFQDFLKGWRSDISLSYAESQILACLHFQQTLPIEACYPSCLWVSNQAPTGLGSTIILVLSLVGQTQFSIMMLVAKQLSGSFLSKERNQHCTLGMRINGIVSLLKLKIFINQIQDNVRNAFKN